MPFRHIYVDGVTEVALAEGLLVAVAAVASAISDISQSLMMGFFRPEDEAKAEKAAYETGSRPMTYLSFMPCMFDEGVAGHDMSRSNRALRQRCRVLEPSRHYGGFRIGTRRQQAACGNPEVGHFDL